MARYLALEWDDREARVAVAQTSGGQAVIEHTFTVDLLPRDADDSSAPTDIGARLSAAMAARGVGKVQTLVAVGRASIELRLMSLPPAPPDDLPEMVRFQAQREFNSLGENWPLDYLPLSGDENTPNEVLAAAISPELVTSITEICESADLRPRRMVLRPCAAASLLQRRPMKDEAKVRLLIDVLGDEADLTALVQGNVVFMRTVRLPGGGDSPHQRTALLGEVRRTMAAVQHQLGGDRIEVIHLCGDRDAHAELAAHLEEQLPVLADVFDPLDGLQLGRELRRERPAQPGRFAPLLGMLVDEAEGVRPAIDFMQPRRKPEPKSRRPVGILAGAAAAVLILALAAKIWMGVRALDSDIEYAKNQLDDLNEQIEAAEDNDAAVAQIKQWKASDVVWLDELAWLSENLPESRDATLRSAHFAANQRDEAVIMLDGRVRESSVMEELQQGLRSPSRLITPRTDSPMDREESGYSWEFKSDIKLRGAPPAPGSSPTRPGLQPRTAARARG
jgi:Tfp pilus assembly PilM family ATPase